MSLVGEGVPQPEIFNWNPNSLVSMMVHIYFFFYIYSSTMAVAQCPEWWEIGQPNLLVILFEHIEGCFSEENFKLEFSPRSSKCDD